MAAGRQNVRHDLGRGAAVLAMTAVLGLLTACGGTAEDSTGTTTPDSSPSASAPAGKDGSAKPSGGVTEQAETLVSITVKGGQIQPLGQRVEAGVGEPVTLRITADAPGEFHVHSTPEQMVEFGKGTSEHKITIDQPGVVEVESHDPAKVVLQLEVR